MNSFLIRASFLGLVAINFASYVLAAQKPAPGTPLVDYYICMSDDARASDWYAVVNFRDELVDLGRSEAQGGDVLFHLTEKPRSAGGVYSFGSNSECTFQFRVDSEGARPGKTGSAEYSCGTGEKTIAFYCAD